MGDWDLNSDPDCKFDADTFECLEDPAPSSHKNAQQFNVTAAMVISHESWDVSKVVNNGNDIAIIRLPREAITSNKDPYQTVLPACLDWDQAYQTPPNTYIVAGWGRTNNDVYDRGDIGSAGAHSSRLKAVELPYIPLDQCKSDYSIYKDITEKQICAGGKRGK